MSAETSTEAGSTAVISPPRPGAAITDWHPEDMAFWEREGARTARRNLILSIFAEHLGFSVWSLWSVFVLFLGPNYHIDPAGKFFLTTVPTVVGSVLRLPYTFAVAKFGGRNWTVFSASLLLVPCILAAFVLKPGVSYSTLMIIAAVAGVGGGNFASSMANINAFYPERLKGAALGLNAGGGNIGVAVVQLLGLLVLSTAGIAHPRLILAVYIPLVVIAALCAALFMNNLTQLRNDKRAMRDATKDPHTWIMSLLYIGTFGSFIGFSFAFGQVLQVQFKWTPRQAADIVWLGPLLGSLIRPVGGALADRVGGAKVTFWNFVLMTLSAVLVFVASQQKSLPLFITGFILLFVFSGIGNGSAYKMIPAIFRAKADTAIEGGADAALAQREARRMSGALIGIAAATGAFGGALVNFAFRESFLTYKSGNAAYIGFIAFYGLCFAVTWAVYLRPGSRRLTGV
ncbi:nitrate/nitrite transporter [Actinocrinis sp.]|uniref:nitrate/nitrite transporter n=1 Tax=Actinocrinis sp. TaxID=1920516 RepID=UPI002D330F36|nr:nitrate/nitrite transporter [Actinocrinis sp.]HZP53808.1 nitrate/nitrite transporter [Actinocrinis sp.]